MFQPPGETHTTVFVFLDFSHVCLAKTHRGFLHRAAKTLCTTSFFFFFLRLFAYKQHWAHSWQLLYWAQLIKNLSRTVFTVRQKKKKNTADRQVKKKKKERKKKHNVYNSPQFLSLYSFVLRAEVISGFSCFQRSLVLTWETQSLG